jgi:monofunctional biosynthetic peptidoglycan transglycosylase
VGLRQKRIGLALLDGRACAVSELSTGPPRGSIQRANLLAISILQKLTQSSQPGAERLGGRVARFFRWAWITALVLAGLVLGALCLYRFVNPPFTALTAARSLMGEPVAQEWVPISDISPHLIRAVVASEDAKFCQHWGIDFGELRAALEHAGDGVARGASTISMQVVKNLFLWPQRSVIRKGLEMPLAVAMELLWSKTRILEVYLNIAEWGPGVFGAEAAAQYHFDKPAAELSLEEATRLAVSLPNPVARDAGDPEHKVVRLAERLQVRMRNSGRVSCIAMPVVARR